MNQTRKFPAGWLWATGAAVVVTAARWREISLHGGEIPYLDQWLVEGRQILQPWLAGRLTWGDFLQPHHEHVPFWPRLLAWLEAVAFGRWDAQLQATVNAGLMGGFAGAAAAWLRRSLPRWPALALTLLVIILASLPHSWENITWGFQSTVPMALLLVFVYVDGTFAEPAGQRRWWFAQAAGLGALFTLGSMWAAPLAVVLVSLWCGAPARKRLLAALLLAVGGAALLVAARVQQPVTGAYTLGAANPRQFVTAFLMQLGWPSAWPGAALLLNLPGFFLALRLRRHARAEPLDQTVVALALWAAAQAAAFAYARGSYAGFVSRYGDLLALGVLANGVALWRLWTVGGPESRRWLAALALGWSAAVGLGLQAINVQGHTLYFHEHSTPWAKVRRDAVRQYLATKDRSHLATADVRGVLFPDPAEIARVLDDPKLAALLPDSVQPAGAPGRGNAAVALAGALRAHWIGFACGGGLLLLAGVWLTAGASASPASREAPPRRPADGTTPAILAALALGSGALLLLWPRPLEFRPEHRWARFLTPAGTVSGVGFRIVTETSYPKDNLAGGAALWPEDFRNTFFGTHIDGPAFTGRAESTPFVLDSPWYVVPFAGYPASAGNALSLRVTDAAGSTVAEIPCAELNPGPGLTDIGFWAVDVRRYAKLTGRLVLTDGRRDGEGWVAAAPPYPTADGPKLAEAHRHDWAAEGTLGGLHSLQMVCAITLLLALGSLLSWRSARR